MHDATRFEIVAESGSLNRRMQDVLMPRGLEGGYTLRIPCLADS